MPHRTRHLWALALLVSAVISAASQEPASPDPLPQGAIRRLGNPSLRPGGEIRGLAVFPDGKQAVTSGPGGVRLWDLDTGGRTARADYPPPDSLPMKSKLPKFSSEAEPVATNGKSVILLRNGWAYHYSAMLDAKAERLPGGSILRTVVNELEFTQCGSSTARH